MEPIRYDGIEETLAYIDTVVAAQGPFDGVLGFSQGACFASLLAMYAAHPDASVRRESLSWLKFVVLYSGFRTRDARCVHQLGCRRVALYDTAPALTLTVTPAAGSMRAC